MSTRCVLDPLPDPSIKVHLRLVKTSTLPRDCDMNFEARLQTTVEEKEETHIADCCYADLRRMTIKRCVML